jgi:hypothetical protein
MGQVFQSARKGQRLIDETGWSLVRGRDLRGGLDRRDEPELKRSSSRADKAVMLSFGSKSWRRCHRTGLFALALAVGVLAAGCASGPLRRPNAWAASYQPSNVYVEESVLPNEIKRVAILPLSVGDGTAEMEFGRETLEPVLAGELFRSRQFEAVLLTPERLARLTGTARWDATGRFAEDFFDRLREELGVQAVLLPELTRYRPHEPLMIGWRLKLVDATEPRVLWAIDEVFDARDPSVAAAARRHAQRHPDVAGSLEDDRAVLQSPRRFGRYTASAVVATLPGHRPVGATEESRQKN